MHRVRWLLALVLLVLAVACSRPEVEAFRRQPAPIQVIVELPKGVPRAETVRAEYTAALQARLATRTTVVREGVTPPPDAVTLQVRIMKMRPQGPSNAPAIIGAIAGVAMGTLSAKAGNSDAALDGLFWGLWAAQEAAATEDAAHSREAHRLGFWPQEVWAEVFLRAPGCIQPLWEGGVGPSEVLAAMDPIPESRADDRQLILEEESTAFARVLVSKLEHAFKWVAKSTPSYWGDLKPEPEPAPIPPAPEPSVTNEPQPSTEPVEPAEPTP